MGGDGLAGHLQRSGPSGVLALRAAVARMRCEGCGELHAHVSHVGAPAIGREATVALCARCARLGCAHLAQLRSSCGPAFAAAATWLAAPDRMVHLPSAWPHLWRAPVGGASHEEDLAARRRAAQRAVAPR